MSGKNPQIIFGNIISSKKNVRVKSLVFSLRCSICSTDNPDKNQFCSSCGKPLPKPHPLTNAVPAGAGQAPVPATPKGSGLWLALLGGGALFLIAVVVVGLFVILPLFEEETTLSDESGISSSYDLTDSDDSDQTVDSPGSLVSGSGEKSGSFPVTATATLRVSQPLQGSSSTPDDLIIGTWDLRSTGMQMQFDTDGVATLRDSTTGDYATGSWQKVSDGKYRLRSPAGTESPVLLSDPIAGTMYFEDYSMIFIRKG